MYWLLWKKKTVNVLKGNLKFEWDSVLVIVILFGFLKLIPWEASSGGIKHNSKTSTELLFLIWFSSGLNQKNKQKNTPHMFTENKYLTVYFVYIFFPLFPRILLCQCHHFIHPDCPQFPFMGIRVSLCCHHFLAPKLLLVFLSNSCRFVRFLFRWDMIVRETCGALAFEMMILHYLLIRLWLPLQWGACVVGSAVLFSSTTGVNCR